ncbi:MAG TPA: EAL domain-containing protein [Thermoanaerobaculia bacterium]|jgi:EAL domain-containing protein (putative c-di-GMP-specific phosphodiesterase class I)/DNA-binding response OmpR family regulator|nr:EAL domain-containing protein [Thermoanaerobaculia bacterium]
MARGRQAVVLVLDDDESVGKFVQNALDSATCRTLWRATVPDAIAKLDDDLPDLALIDIELGATENGWDPMRALRDRPETRTIPIVMMTGSSDTMNRERSLRMGADRYLIKPVSAETLRRVTGELLSVRDDIWWTMTLRTEQAARLRELFFDPTTDVPTLAVVVDDLRRIVERGDTLLVFCIEIEPLFRMGERNLWDAFDDLRRHFVRGLRVMVGPLLGNDVVIGTSHSGANDFYCFAVAHPSANVPQIARDLERVARATLKALPVDPSLKDEVVVFSGGASTQPQPLFAPRILYNAVREAKDNAERRETRYYHAMRERLIRTVHDRLITTVFQPVVNLETRAIVGYEALSRGPAGTELENPEVMFELARDFDVVWDLEALCIQNVVPYLTDVTSRGYLFFNLESHFIQQLQQRGTDIFEPFFRCNRQVVIEVTERSAIRDYGTFRRTLHELKKMGFKIAIDDCGSGYATLEAVAELQPDYLKVGHSLFHGVDTDPIRRRLVELVARCAETIGARTIAEAIETEAQLKVCRELGITEGQGYLLARPAPWETFTGEDELKIEN